MISIIVVGRNDNHGYNLHKRVSSSLNSLANILTDEDELIFVDWNTPLGYPVMPITIQDDLLERTKKLLKIIRVSPSIHRAVSGDSNRELIEPTARNVGIRHASPKSDWILSTNTDILIASPSGKSLQQICDTLEQTLWQSFRFEMPEFVWEQLDRRAPAENAEKIVSWHAQNLMTRRITVRGSSALGFKIPDGVGDFQLAPREIWEAVTGFAEDMIKGWHVDTRLSIQMSRIVKVKPAIINEDDLIIFHQNHLRNSTMYHDSSATNSIDLVMQPYQNADSWGLMEYSQIEVNDIHSLITLNDIIELSNVYKLIAHKSEITLDSILSSVDYDLSVTLIFLTDELSILPAFAVIHCYSENEILIEMLKVLAEKMRVIIYFKNVDDLVAGQKEENVNLLILDFGVAKSGEVKTADASNWINFKLQKIGMIALSIPEIAGIYSGFDTRVACIRAQNWAMRELSRTFFNFPLFNNYTSILCGTIKERHTQSVSQISIFQGGIMNDYGITRKTLKTPDLKRISFIHKSTFMVARKILSFLPAPIGNKVKSLLKRVFFPR
jgi:hypothetical protein